jgi:hypothetical protein
MNTRSLSGHRGQRSQLSSSRCTSSALIEAGEPVSCQPFTGGTESANGHRM